MVKKGNGLLNCLNTETRGNWSLYWDTSLNKKCSKIKLNRRAPTLKGYLGKDKVV